MDLINEIPDEFSTISFKLDPQRSGAKELDKIRQSSQKALDQEKVDGEIIQMLYDFRDNMMIFKIKKA